MFRNQGASRTVKHNLQIASLLSFVAGIINIVGLIALNKLTTNITGHFAFFINDISHFNFLSAAIYLIFVISFLVGSFTSSLLIEFANSNKKFNIFLLPILLESLLLISVSFTVHIFPNTSFTILANLLLFAMGVQNSFVTKISNTVVRTTHLTGLFTDLGIELSQLLFKKRNHQSIDKIKSTIKLRLFIISFFFFGGIFGSYLYTELQLDSLIIASIILIMALFYDNLKYTIKLANSKMRNR